MEIITTPQEVLQFDMYKIEIQKIKAISIHPLKPIEIENLKRSN